VDTDVVSYLLNRHSLAAVYEKLLIDHTPLVSFMTVAEPYRGALKKKWGQRRRDMARAHACRVETFSTPSSVDKRCGAEGVRRQECRRGTQNAHAPHRLANTCEKRAELRRIMLTQIARP
jgi:predicted nucleic acid-binding protein